MTKRNAVLWLVVVAALVAIVVVFRNKVQFDWAMFMRQLRFVSLGHVVAGILLIYLAFVVRAARWSVFLAPTKKVSAISLIGSQYIGFAAVALFGRLADLTRPYLVARRVGLSLSSQIAVYTIERMFDLGAAAIIFSSALAFTPKDLPHHEIFVRAGVVRVAGGAVAKFTRAVLQPLSKPLAESIATKIIGFRDGLNVIASKRDFVLAVVLSLSMWGMIGGAYQQALHSFTNTPELATLSFSRTMLLMAASIGGSLIQLPIIGWFTQIAVSAAAMHAFYGAPIEAATACAAVLLLVTWLCVIPPGLIYARVEHVSLKKVAAESEAAGKETEIPVGEADHG